MLREHTKSLALQSSLASSNMRNLLRRLIKCICGQKVESPPKEDQKPSVYDMPNDEFDYGHNVPIHRDTFVEDF